MSAESEFAYINCDNKTTLRTKKFIEKGKVTNKNNFNYIKTIVIGMDKKTTIICPLHGEFRTYPHAHYNQNNGGCSGCTVVPLRISQEDFISNCKKNHGMVKYDYSKTKYSGAKNSATFICYQHGEFIQNCGKHMAGKGCYKCGKLAMGKAKSINKSKFLKRVKLKFNDEYNYDNVIYINYTSPIDIVCKIHGIFTQTPKDHYDSQGCIECVKLTCKENLKLSQKEVIRRFEQNHGSGTYDYSLVKYNGYFNDVKIICHKHGIIKQSPARHAISKPICCSNKAYMTKDIFISMSNKKYENKFNYSQFKFVNRLTSGTIICPTHGKISLSPNQHYTSKHGCPSCANKNCSLLLSNNISDFIKKANSIHNKYDYSKSIYINQNTKLIITCKKHGDFLQTPGSHLANSGCPKCCNRISTKEGNWLKSLNISDLIYQYKIPNTRLFADAYDAKTNTIYEFYGTYWHADPTKYSLSEYTSKSKSQTFEDVYNRTVKREIRIRKLGYNFHFMWESDFKEIL